MFSIGFMEMYAIGMGMLFTAALMFVLWLWALLDCFGSKLETSQKLFWVMVILLLNVFGAVLYFIFSNKEGENIIRSNNFRGRKLLRSRKDRMIAGVCGGIGDYLDVDPTVIRLLWVFFTVASFGFGGFIAYAVAWIIIPEESSKRVQKKSS